MTDKLLAPDLVVAVFGAGTMGRGIAQVCAQAGIKTLLSDTRDGAVKEAIAAVAKALDGQVAKGRMTEDAKRDMLANLESDVLVKGGRQAIVQARTPYLESRLAHPSVEPFKPDVVLARQMTNDKLPKAVEFRPDVRTTVAQVDGARWLRDVETLATFNRYTHGTQIIQARDFLVQQLSAAAAPVGAASAPPAGAAGFVVWDCGARDVVRGGGRFCCAGLWARTAGVTVNRREDRRRLRRSTPFFIAAPCPVSALRLLSPCSSRYPSSCPSSFSSFEPQRESSAQTDSYPRRR